MKAYETVNNAKESGYRNTADIKKLAGKTAAYITDTPEHWMSYLETAARIYRYKFYDQLLIYAQKPNATACATYDQWRNRVQRPVKKGGIGIALFNPRDERKLRYVFDISDTIDNGNGPVLWNLTEDLNNTVYEYLKGLYRLDAESLSDILLHIARAEVANINVMELNNAMKEYGSQSTGENVREEERQLLINSIFYILSKRCNLDTAGVVGTKEFESIRVFAGSLWKLSFIGTKIQSICEPILKEIGKIAARHQKLNQGGIIHGNADVSHEKSSSVSRPYTHGGKENGAGKVRQDAQRMAGRNQTGDIYSDASLWNPARRMQTGGRGDGEADERVYTEISGTGSEYRSDRLGNAHEEIGKRSRAEDSPRTGIQSLSKTTGDEWPSYYTENKYGARSGEKDSRCIYKECLYSLAELIRSEIAGLENVRWLREGIAALPADVGECNCSYLIVQNAIDEIMKANRRYAPVMYDAYWNWENFRKCIWLDTCSLFLEENPDSFQDLADCYCIDERSPDWINGIKVHSGKEILTIPENFKVISNESMRMQEQKTRKQSR